MKLLLAAFALLIAVAANAFAYIDTPPPTFGAMCEFSRGVVVFKVVRTDAERRIVVLDKVRDIKRKFPSDNVTLSVGPADDSSSAKLVSKLEKDAEFTAFYLQGKTTCPTYVYFADAWHYGVIEQNDSGKWSGTMTPSPRLLGIYSGKSDELAAAAKKVLDGDEIILPSLTGSLKDLTDGKGKPRKLKAGLKRIKLDPDRDEVPEKR